MTPHPVIFDLGGVILSWNPRAVVRRLFAEPAVQGKVLAEVFHHPDWVDLDRGSLREAQAIGRFAERTSRSASEMAALLQAVKESLQPIPDSIVLLQELAQADVPLYALSNMASETFAFLRARYDFWSLFRGLCLSGELGLIKPDERIFRHMADQFALTPEHTFFVDDSVPNVEAARGLGFRAVLFKSALDCRARLLKGAQNLPD